MTDINPPPIPRLPPKWYADPDIRAYQDAINKIIFQLWVTSSSGPLSDPKDQDSVSALIGSVYSDLFSELDSIYSHTEITNYTTIGNEIIRCTAALTITLNSTPDDGETVVVYHDGTTGDAVLVTDGSNTDTIKVKNSVVCYVYYVDLGKWVP